MDWLALVVAGGLVDRLVSVVLDRLRDARELRQNDNVRIDGHWYAAWQTSVDGNEVITTQPITLIQRGRTIRMKNEKRSSEHPKGGYLWRSKLHFYHGRYAMGQYVALPGEQNSSKGIMYFYYRSQHKLFYGVWAGSSHDSDLSAGFLVMAQEQEEARASMTRLLADNPTRVPINVFGEAQ
ncbi:MAG: hypothetical protein ACRCYU_09190 [Nocardioides sp.]